MNMKTRIIEPGQVEAPFGEIRYLFLPGRDLFARRANRFRNLADNHPLSNYMTFLALLADAQQKALNQFPSLPHPDSDEQAQCRNSGMPLLNAQSWCRHPAWRVGLSTILNRMSEGELTTAARETVAGLLTVDESRVEETADRIVEGDFDSVSPRELPLIAAAIQVYWVQMASALGGHTFAKREQDSLCPVCGSYPVAGIVHTGGTEQGLRYLSCSLCASQWHMVRIKCSTCESTDGINLYTMEGSNGAVKAETCDGCNSYLKLLYLNMDNRMEDMADDLATLTLDMLMDETGKVRCGPNLFFHPGRV